MKKIIYISYSFEKGGAAKAASNIYDCLKKKTIIKKYNNKKIIKDNFFSFIKILLFNIFFKTILRSKNKFSFNLTSQNSFEEYVK